MDPINWHSIFFLAFALLACGFAVMVVLSSNIVRMAVGLVLSLGAVAGLFFLAGADLVGTMQLMVYVGGTVVLLVFGVMLTARGPLAQIKTSPGQWMLALVVGGCLLVVLWQTAFSVKAWRGQTVRSDRIHAVQGETARPGPDESGPYERQTAAPIGMALLGVRVDQPAASGGGASGKTVSGYLLAFEIISVHLVVVLVGAAYLARARRRVVGGGSQPGGVRRPPDSAGGC